MLPGVELARRRRVHYHGDAAAKSSSSAGAGEHHHHHFHHGSSYQQGAPAVAGPALAARIRLEEKLRGAALPPTPTPTSPSSRWSRLMRHHRQQDDQQVQAQEQQQAHQPATTGAAEPCLPSPPGVDPAAVAAASATRRRRAELTRTLSKVDVCAVCLEEVREDRPRRQRVTRLPCSHKYHSECVLPWLAIQPDCPCCRALVPSAVHALLIP